MSTVDPAQDAELVRERLDAAETCARLLRDHLTGDGGFGGKPKLLDCAGCRDAVEAWERTALNDGDGASRPSRTGES